MAISAKPQPAWCRLLDAGNSTVLRPALLTATTMLSNFDLM